MADLAAASLGPVATRMLFENDDVKVWEMNLAPGEFCGLHRHELDYVLYILEGATVEARHPERPSFTLKAVARGVYLVPAGGVESAHNVGPTRFREALFELKRPPRRGRSGFSYVACEALADAPPHNGLTRIVENDRVRISELTLAPGEESGARSASRDSALFVIEGGLVAIDEDSRQRREQRLAADQVLWLSAGGKRNFVNRGDTRYRHLSLELM